MENAISEGLLANTLIEGYRCQSETLLLGTIENMLIQSLLLLRNQPFLECHLGVQVMRIPQRLIQEVVHSVSLQLLILSHQVFLTLSFLQFKPLGDSLQVLTDVAAQDLLFGLDAIVADQFFFDSMARHPTIVLSDSVDDKVDLVLVERGAGDCWFFVFGDVYEELFGGHEWIPEAGI